MKNTTIYAFALMMLTVACQKNINVEIPGFTTTEAKGPVTEKSYDMTFDKVEVSQSIEAKVIKADRERVVIYAPENLHDRILVDLSGGKLHIRFKPGINISSGKVRAEIYAKDFTELEANSSATIEVSDKFTQDKTTLKAKSSGTISGNMEANEFSVDVSSSGSVKGQIWAVNLDVGASSSGFAELSGKAKNVKMDASSSGSISAKNLAAENADLEASSSGSIAVSVSGQLETEANSSGSISVIKNGVVTIVKQKEGSSGNISIQE